MSWSKWTEVGEGYRDPYPEALRALRRAGASGVYAIRDKRTRQVLYVGSSRTGRLYETLTRHLQDWHFTRRLEWGKAIATGRDTTSPTYDRGDVEVKWSTTSPADALAVEDEAIRELAPRDNEDGPPVEAGGLVESVREVLEDVGAVVDEWGEDDPF